MRYTLPMLVLTATLMASGCASDAEATGDPVVAETLAPSQKPEPAVDNSGDERIETMFIDSALVDCIGEAPQKCMRVRNDPSAEWLFFYDSIGGFSYEEGNSYELLVEVIPVDDPPADGSSLRYELIELVSVTPA